MDRRGGTIAIRGGLISKSENRALA